MPSQGHGIARAFILAGGKGTRIRSVDATVPKPLVKIAGREVLFRQLDLLEAAGIGDITVIAGYMGELMQEAIDREYHGRIKTVIEPFPLGSGGCLSMVRTSAQHGTSLVLSGDLVLDMDFAKLSQFHAEKSSRLTLTVHPNTHPRDSDLVACDAHGRVSHMLLRPHGPAFSYHNLVNAAVCLLEPDIWRFIPEQQDCNFEKDIVTATLAAGLPVYAYNTSEYIRDMGTPDRWAGVTQDILSGLTQARSLRNPQRAVFVDRDGVLNEFRDFITKPEQIELIPGVVEAIRKLNRSPFLTILVTNQPQIAKGFCTLDELDLVHKRLETLLGDASAKLDAMFFCPHHPDAGFPGENKEFKVDCNCRKPKPGMLLAAAERFNIDLSASYLVGDTTTDIAAGAACGVKTILVATGLGGKDGKSGSRPDWHCKDLQEAVDRIVLESSA